MSLEGYRYSSNGRVYFVCVWCKFFEIVGHSTITVKHQHEGDIYDLIPVKLKSEAVAMCKGRSKTKQTAKTHPTLPI